MKKEILIWPVTIIIVALIIGLIFYFLQINKQKISKENNNIAEQAVFNTKTDNNEFAKKIECEKYKDQIIKKINQYNSIQKPEVRDSNNSGEGEPINNLYVESNEFKGVFYSSKVNSCLYVEIRRTLVKRGAEADPNVGNWGVSSEYYYLIDALTSKEIDFNEGMSSFQTINRSEQLRSKKEANDLIDQYR